MPDLSDTIEHHGTMTRYAEKCDVIVECGVHYGGSTRAFLKGVKGRLYSWDIERLTEVDDIKDEKWVFNLGDAGAADIPECDMLFIDSEHSRKQVTRELAHHAKVRKWIMLHDTVTYMAQVVPAILHFLTEHPEWIVLEHYENNNGLTILERV